MQGWDSRAGNRYTGSVKAKKQKLLVGLTGGIGSGKSAVADILRKKGLAIIDADKLSREVVAPGSPALQEIVALAGSEVLNPDGKLNRHELRHRIFNDPSLREKVEGIMHPRIRKLGRERADALFKQGNNLVLYEAPLLIEAGNYQHLDAIIGVRAKDELRIERIMKRDGISREEAEKAIASQMPQEKKMQYCDYVIQNDSTLADLEGWVEAVLRQLYADNKGAKHD